MAQLSWPRLREINPLGLGQPPLGRCQVRWCELGRIGQDGLVCQEFPGTVFLLLECYVFRQGYFSRGAFLICCIYASRRAVSRELQNLKLPLALICDMFLLICRSVGFQYFAIIF